MDMPLLLDDYFFPHVISSATSKPNDAIPIADCDFELGVNVTKGDDEDGNEFYQVAVKINSCAPSEEEHNLYEIELVVVGHFKVDENFSDPVKLLEVTGASMLYSAAREYLITVTSRGPWGPVTLPTASFLNLYNQKLEQLAIEDSEEEASD